MREGESRRRRNERGVRCGRGVKKGGKECSTRKESKKELLPTSLPTLLCRMATRSTWVVTNLSERRAGDTQAFVTTSVRQQFMSAVGQREKLVHPLTVAHCSRTL